MDKVQMFACSHCGEVRAFAASDARARKMAGGETDCRTCLQGTMKEIVADSSVGSAVDGFTFKA